MVHHLAQAGICARRNGINASLAEVPIFIGTKARGSRSRLCRKFLASTFQREPNFAPGLMKWGFLGCLNG
jgi:hypothetical protein